MLMCVSLVTDHRRRQNVARTSVTHSPNGWCYTSLFLSHFDVICDILVKRRTATWKLFSKLHNLIFIQATPPHPSLFSFEYRSSYPVVEYTNERTNYDSHGETITKERI